MMHKQKECKTLGEEGCYFFSLLWIAEQELGKSLDALAVFDVAKERGWVEADCYMTDPAALMSFLLGKPCQIRKSWDFAEPLAVNEREVRCFERKATGTTYYHFVVADGDRILYDPLEASRTVVQGKPHSRRIVSVGEAR